MAHKQCITRLQKEYKSLLKDPVPNITAHPSPSTLLEWHYVLEGTKGTEYEGGVYHGKIVFPPEYPFKPPSISLFTPNGRFATNTKLCLSMTDFHPESWNPMWSVGTILTGLLSFMYDTQATTGSITTSKQEKERLAKESLAFNAKNPTFKKLFPHWLEELARRQAAAAQPSAGQPGVAPPAAVPANGAANGGTAKAAEANGQHRQHAEDAAEARMQGGQQQNGVAGGREGAEGAAAGAGAAAGRGQGGHGLGGSLVTIALVVAVLAVVLVGSTGRGDILRSWLMRAGQAR